MENILSSNMEPGSQDLEHKVLTARKRKMKDLYACLLNHPVFTVEDVNVFYGNIDSSRSAVKRLMKEGIVVKIRNDRYTCLDLETKKPVANHYQVATSLTDTAYLSHHSAMEYHGVAANTDHCVYVSSITFFHDFEFNGYSYVYIPSKCEEGIIQPESHVSVSDLERSVVDSIKLMDKISGMSEVVASLSKVGKLDEEKMLKYLAAYDSQFLYQKLGYMLSFYKEQTGLSDAFFQYCMDKIGKSRRYLTNDMSDGRYDSDWKMMVPVV